MSKSLFLCAYHYTPIVNSDQIPHLFITFSGPTNTLTRTHTYHNKQCRSPECCSGAVRPSNPLFLKWIRVERLRNGKIVRCRPTRNSGRFQKSRSLQSPEPKWELRTAWPPRWCIKSLLPCRQRCNRAFPGRQVRYLVSSRPSLLLRCVL